MHKAFFPVSVFYVRKKTGAQNNIFHLPGLTGIIAFRGTRKSVYPLLFLFLLLLSGRHASTQILNPDQRYRKQQDLVFEKIYLHTDRNSYTIKDDIWLGIYLVDGKEHLPLTGANNVYVDLVDSQGKVLLHKPFLVYNGFGDGSLIVSDSLKSGIYNLYSYTNYLLNFGIPSAFRKEIMINNPVENLKPGGQVKTGNPRGNQRQQYRSVNMTFMPEGGYLSQGNINTLAFRTETMGGGGINLSGAVFDPEGNFIDSLESYHKGMGILNFKPVRAAGYFAILDGFPSDTFFIPEAVNKPLLSYAGISDSIVILKIIPPQNNNITDKYFIAVRAKSRMLFYIEKKISSDPQVLRIHQRNFNPGINQVILLDDNLVPLSERLVFIPGISQAGIDITLTGESYGNREKIEVNVEFPDSSDYNAGGSFSAAVVNLERSGLNEIKSDNIVSWLELSSEIRGKIEDPESYFSEPYNSVKDKLDLLMLTQGWRRYIWNESLTDSLPGFKREKEFGFPVTGHAKKLFGQAGLEDGNIILFAPEAKLILETTTDSTGFFRFDNLVLYDSTKIAVQSRDRKNKKNSRLIDADYNISPPAGFSGELITHYDTAGYHSLVSKAAKYRDDYLYTDFSKTSIQLEEVVVVAEKKEDDGHFRMYSQANNVVNMDDYPTAGYSDLFVFLQGRVPGLFVSGDRISIRMNSGPPLFLLDGMEIDAAFARSLTLSDIDKVEVLKDASNTAVFGLRGGNGVIAIYTKRGEISFKDIVLFDMIAKSIDGFARAKEFYSPDYEKTSPDPSKTDSRVTLFWAPVLFPDSTGSVTFSFYTGDETGRYAIITEGILNNGKPVWSKSFFEVRKR